VDLAFFGVGYYPEATIIFAWARIGGDFFLQIMVGRHTGEFLGCNWVLAFAYHHLEIRTDEERPWHDCGSLPYLFLSYQPFPYFCKEKTTRMEVIFCL
jgi:hypothetical protein